MRVLLVFFFFLFVIPGIIGQSLRGKIVDIQKQAIPDAYVYLSNGKAHSHTNDLGYFTINNIQEGDTLITSYLGFKQKEYIINKNDLNTELVISLEEVAFQLDQVNIIQSLKSVNVVTAIDLEVNPVKSSQEVLQKVPGLFIAQHAGGGKAEQIFLRGFDIDHGTDIAISVDGMPVNMVSHAHGQGYADLHWLIPETIENIDFGKGPYYAEHGNLNTAGYVDFKTKDRLEESVVSAEFGDFNSRRNTVLISLLNEDRKSAYMASELISTNGPFNSPQNFSRFNVMAKFHQSIKENDRLSFSISHFQSNWDASGQIPDRLVRNSVINRFGSVDDTEGGNTGRTNAAMDYTHEISKKSFFRTRAYYSHYDFRLYSNFTFFLNDLINGDQIMQSEERRIFGIHSNFVQESSMAGFPLEFKYGLGFRYDDINNNELTHTASRTELINQIALGDIDETNLFVYATSMLDLGQVLINLALRTDHINFQYNDRHSPNYNRQTKDKFLLLPKLNIIYNPTTNFQIFFKSGQGFHSNDSRVSVRQNQDEMPTGLGSDLGVIWKPIPQVWLNTTLWILNLDQEFVYVGDEGVVEPNGRTSRKGIDLSLRIQLASELFFDGDLTLTHGRFKDIEEGNNRIPLAPLLSASGGFVYRSKFGLNSGLRFRYLAERPALEDYSIKTHPYFVVDFNCSYDLGQFRIGINVENLFNTEWEEAQFATVTRLKDEIAAVEEIHFTPGVPFFLRASASYRF